MVNANVLYTFMHSDLYTLDLAHSHVNIDVTTSSIPLDQSVMLMLPMCLRRGIILLLIYLKEEYSWIYSFMPLL
jgi:hypothetical protein